MQRTNDHRWLLPIRSEWLGVILTKLQEAAGLVGLVEREDVRDELANVTDWLPDRQSRMEHLLLRGLLLEFACRSGSVIHDLRSIIVECGVQPF